LFKYEKKCLGFVFDSKACSLLLHGILLAQVNVGPLFVAKTFISDENINNYDAQSVNRLKEVFIEFVQVLAEAVGRNKQEITPIQLTVQNQIEIAYFRFKSEISILTKENLENIVETFTEPEDFLAQMEDEQTISTSEQSSKPKKHRLTINNN